MFFADLLLVHIRYNVLSNILDYIYFFTSLCWLYFLQNKEYRKKLIDEFNRYTKFSDFTIYFSVVITVFCIITKIGYVKSWDGMYYVGLSELTHTAASSLCLVNALILFNKNKKGFSWVSLLMMLLLSYAIFETGARTYIISAVIIIYLYVHDAKEIKNYKHIVYPIIVVLCFIILSKSNIVDKINFSKTPDKYNKVDSLTQQTSGRSTFWIIDLKGFVNGDLFDKLFGHGHGYTYYLNKTYYNLNVWAHNDFIQLIVGGGIITLLLYLAELKKLSIKVLKNKRMMLKIIFYTYYLFPAFFNGFYNYSHYFLSFVLIVCYYELISEGKDIK